MNSQEIAIAPLETRHIVRTWMPLGASWTMILLELPLVSVIMLRLPNPEVSLAAYGGVVFPILMILSAPIIMMLAAATALAKDWGSYIKLRRFMIMAGATLTVIHALLAFTPFGWKLVSRSIPASPDILEAAKLGLMLMLPYVWGTAWRRFNQGLLVRFQYAITVGVATVVRLGVMVVTVTLGAAYGTIPTIALVSGAVLLGVVCEATFVALQAWLVVRRELKHAPQPESTLSWRDFGKFYAPLAATAIISLLIQPMSSMALVRMPHMDASLTVWPVLSGLIILFCAPGYSYQEVVIALMAKPQGLEKLRRATTLVVALTTLVLFLFIATPLADLFFVQVSQLRLPLATLASHGSWIGLIIPGLIILQSWFQGQLLYHGHSRTTTEAIVVYLVVSGVILFAGIMLQLVTGLYVALAAFTLGALARASWLWYRCST